MNEVNGYFLMLNIFGVKAYLYYDPVERFNSYVSTRLRRFLCIISGF